MHSKFAAVIDRDGEWFVAFCPEVQSANGQGHSRDEALGILRKAIQLILEDRDDAIYTS